MAVSTLDEYGLSYGSAWTAYDQGQYRDAIAHCDHAIFLDAKLSWAVALRALCNLRLGHTLLALHDARDALQLSDANAIAHLVCGALALRERRFCDADFHCNHKFYMSDASDALKVRNFVLAQSYAAIDQFQDAYTNLELGRAVGAITRQTCMISRAILHQLTGQHNLAISLYHEECREHHCVYAYALQMLSHAAESQFAAVDELWRTFCLLDDSACASTEHKFVAYTRSLLLSRTRHQNCGALVVSDDVSAYWNSPDWIVPLARLVNLIESH